MSSKLTFKFGYKDTRKQPKVGEGELTCDGNSHSALARHCSSRVDAFSSPFPTLSFPPQLFFSFPFGPSTLSLPSQFLFLSPHLFESISVAATVEPAATVACFPALWQKVTLSLAATKGGGRTRRMEVMEVSMCQRRNKATKNVKKKWLPQILVSSFLNVPVVS